MKRVITATLAIAVVGILLFPSLAAASAATDQLKASIDGIIAILSDPSLKGPEMAEKRREKIRIKIHERFSFHDMAKRSLGKAWRARSKEERQEFVTIFSQLIQDSYIGKIEGYSDEKVLYDNEILRKRTAVIKTRIITKEGTDIPLDYRLIEKPGGTWMVYDVIIEGISLVRNYRTQFSTTISSSSYENLVNKLKSKVQ